MIERWLRFGGRRWRPAAGVLLGALVCLVVVVAVPHDVGRVLIPGELLLLAVVMATVVGGPFAGSLVLVGSAVALLYYFIPERQSFLGGSAADYVSVVLYLLGGAVLVAAVGFLIV